jgi:CheY-like chemotaxis protein
MSREPIKVMVVEDEVLIGLMLAKKLRAHGFELTEVLTTGEEAVEQAVKLQPAVILMDVVLAGSMSGLEAAQHITRATGIPIIIFTGYNDGLVREQAPDFKPAAVLTKMESIAAIVAAINRAAGRS